MCFQPEMRKILRTVLKHLTVYLAFCNLIVLTVAISMFLRQLQLRQPIESLFIAEITAGIDQLHVSSQ